MHVEHIDPDIFLQFVKRSGEYLALPFNTEPALRTTLDNRTDILDRIRKEWGKGTSSFADILHHLREAETEDLAFAVELYILSAGGFYANRVAHLRDYLKRIDEDYPHGDEWRRNLCERVFYSLIGLLRAVHFLTYWMPRAHLANKHKDEGDALIVATQETMWKYLSYPFRDGYGHDVADELRQELASALESFPKNAADQHPNKLQLVMLAQVQRLLQGREDEYLHPLNAFLCREFFAAGLAKCDRPSMLKIVMALRKPS